VGYYRSKNRRSIKGVKLKEITVQFCSDKRISKTPCLLVQNEDKSWSVLMYFKKGKHAEQKHYDYLMECFKRAMVVKGGKL